MISTPRGAMILGWSGVLPFVGLAAALAVGLGGPDQVSDVLRLYGSIILSFMGGVHWGVAILRNDDRLSAYAVSVVPALWAFALAFTPATIAFSGLVVGFVGLLIYDVGCVGRGHLPEWYGRLRQWLTLAVCACLVAAAVVS